MLGKALVLSASASKPPALPTTTSVSVAGKPSDTYGAGVATISERTDTVNDILVDIDEVLNSERPKTNEDYIFLAGLAIGLLSRAHDELTRLRECDKILYRELREANLRTNRWADEIAKTRTEALEQAAGICDQVARNYTIDIHPYGAEGCASEIRALKDKPHD